MTRVALDSNILIYAELEPDSDKGTRAIDLILAVARDGVIPVQVLGEYLRFVQRRLPNAFEQAVRQASLYGAAFLTPPTTSAVMDMAAALAREHRMQLWDCVVCAAAAQAGAKVLMTEDMQDRHMLAGLQLINPFIEANSSRIDALLAR
jgi:predicted nucleic acid-binding protein